MTTLKANETLALERGRVSAGQTFWLHNQEAADQLVAAGLAEEVAEGGPANPLDSEPDSGPTGVKVKTDKSADTRKTKPEAVPVLTKDNAGPDTGSRSTASGSSTVAS